MNLNAYGSKQRRNQYFYKYRKQFSIHNYFTAEFFLFCKYSRLPQIHIGFADVLNSETYSEVDTQNVTHIKKI